MCALSEPTRGLKFDRRLIQRRGWVDPEELRRYLDALPDVSDKIRRPEESEEPGRNASPGEGESEGGSGKPPAGA